MISPPQHHPCPRCGYPLAPDSQTMGLCPRCLLTRVLDVRKNMQMQLDRIRPWPDAPSPEALQAAMPGLEVMELIAHGGMGLIYRARQKDLQRDVALKILPIDALQDATIPARFQTEARILAGLNHPNIVMAIEAGQTRDWLYLVMELVHGPTLREVMKREGKLQPRHALTIAAQIGSALTYAHARQIIHRDIKPENILLDPGDRPADAGLDAFFAGGGRVRLADFGIAKSLHHPVQEMTLTGPDQLFGTADYIAPECRQAGHAPSPASDIYALGVVLYEMLAGHIPAGHFPPPSRLAPVSRKVDAIILRCLAADPTGRYPSATQLHHALIKALSHRPLSRVLMLCSLALLLACALITMNSPKPRSTPSTLPAPIPVASDPPPTPQPPATRPSVFVLMPGDAVQVQWGDQWYNATVIQREGRRVQVHFDGWSSTSDEWVGPDRLKW